MSEESATKDPMESSAFPGCFILAAIVTVFGGLIVLYVVVFFVQKGRIADFTEEEPAIIKQFSPSDEEIMATRGKLSQVESAAKLDRRERILFNAKDLNTMIASYEILKDFRGTTYVDSITSRGIETRMAHKVRTAPFSSKHRHLNATYIFSPELRKRTIALRVRDILADVGSVPEAFVEGYDTIGFFKLDPDNEAIKACIPKMSRVYIEGESVVIETGRQSTE